MKKKLGILGGMGPQATADLFQKIIDKTNAARDAEHLRIFIDNNPQIPDRIAAVLEGKGDVQGAMQKSLQVLENCGADVIVVPCVTAHYFLPQLKSSALVLDMLDVITDVCNTRFYGKTAGILSSTATAQCGLVTNRLAAGGGIKYLSPLMHHQEKLGHIILQVKAKKAEETLPCFKEILREMQGRGADFFILACSELPIIAQFIENEYNFLNVTDELAATAIHACEK